MAIKLTINGIEITASTAQEAAALIREFAPPRTTSKDSSPSNQHELPMVPLIRPFTESRPLLQKRTNDPDTSKRDVATIAMRFLRTVSKAPHTGASVGDVMAALQVGHPKGIGSRMAQIHELLEKRGFKDPVGEVYTTTRTPSGRVWKSAPGMTAAIDGVQAVLRGSEVSQ